MQVTYDYDSLEVTAGGKRVARPKGILQAFEPRRFPLDSMILDK